MARPPHRLRAGLLAAALCLAPPAAGAAGEASGGAAEAGARPQGHRRMVALLAELAEREPLDLPFRRARDRAAERLASLPADAPAAERVRLLATVAELDGRLGEMERSLDGFRRAREEALGLDAASRRGILPVLSFNLAATHLRAAETLHAAAHRSGESSILPLLSGGVHRDAGGSEAASRRLTEVLEMTRPGEPLHLAARWLLNLAAMTLGRYPQGVPDAYRIDPSTFTSDAPFPRFPNVAPALGLDVYDLAGGAVAEDLDGDGDLDLFTTTVETGGPVHLFRNDGDRFTERSREAGLEGITGGVHALQADYDGDGRVDLLILRGGWNGELGRHPNSLLHNDGGLRFTDVTFEAGLGEVHYPAHAAAWADYDGDGDVDLFIGNESNERLRAPSQLFENDGAGRFRDVAARAGVRNDRWAKGATWGDFNGDGRPDLYVSNLNGNNRLYRNNGNGTFTDVAIPSLVLAPRSSFTAWFWDYDNDGNLDLLVNSWQLTDKEPGTPHLWYVVAGMLGLPQPAEPPVLYRGDGRGGFRDLAAAAGIARPTLPMGANFGDLDNDGFLDFFLGTGYPGYEGLMPNVMFRSDAGARFLDVTYAGGFGHLQKGHGIAFADLDNDGDQDVFGQMGGMFSGDAYHNALWENPGFGRHWAAVDLAGAGPNRAAIGAHLRVDLVEDGSERSIHRHVSSGGSFGANPLRQEIGLGKASRIERLQVRWPGTGAVQAFRGLPADRFLRLVEGRDATREPSTAPRPPR